MMIKAHDKSIETSTRDLSKGLMMIWKEQRGLCALSGRKLDRSAHIDHILPRSRGGSNKLSNLQFLAPEVNVAKSNMTDEEFIKLCQDVVNNSKQPKYPGKEASVEGGMSRAA